MPANLTDPRPDMVYLRRRLKRGETAPTSATANVSTNSLSLSLNQDVSSSDVFVEKETPVSSPIPNAVGLSSLKAINDAYRLNRRQSAIGSLIIGNAMVAGWQMTDGSSGYLYNSGVHVTESPESTPKEYKNRALVEFRNGLLIVGLRNVKYLKRLIVIPKLNETLQAETLGGAGVTMDYESFTALYVSTVDSVVELRKESFRNTLTETFNLHTVKSQIISDKTPSLRTLFS